jgi:hypothetical protein
MDVGMLWFDGDHEKELEQRIGQAARYYRTKYGRTPNMCLIHPKTMRESTLSEAGGLQIQTSSAVLPDHFWLGVEPTERDSQDIRLAA